MYANLVVLNLWWRFYKKKRLQNDLCVDKTRKLVEVRLYLERNKKHERI